MRSDTKDDKRPRGRPRTFDADDVLDKVRRVFMEKGYAAASLDDLAAASGLARPSLYGAFGDKQQLYIAALRFYARQILTGMESILAKDEPLERRLTNLFRAAIRLYTAPPTAPGCMIIGTAATEAPAHPDIAAAARALLADTEAALEHTFARAVAEREIGNKPSPKARARMATALLDTLAIRARLRTPPAELEEFARLMLPTICK
jgi:TetR/AcrR family transcriptional regulator, copper-responsive repressor